MIALLPVSLILQILMENLHVFLLNSGKFIWIRRHIAMNFCSAWVSDFIVFVLLYESFFRWTLNVNSVIAHWYDVKSETALPDSVSCIL